jgi:hypothetical protein
MEAKYNALNLTMRDLLPLKALVATVQGIVGFTEIEITTIKTTVWEENIGAWALANIDPGCSTPRSKHYAIKTHWFCGHLKLKAYKY